MKPAIKTGTPIKKTGVRINPMMIRTSPSVDLFVTATIAELHRGHVLLANRPSFICSATHCANSDWRIGTHDGAPAVLTQSEEESRF
jgi:hypothetical protein